MEFEGFEDGFDFIAQIRVEDFEENEEIEVVEAERNQPQVSSLLFSEVSSIFVNLSKFIICLSGKSRRKHTYATSKSS